MNASPSGNGWSLEVVRGKDVGRRYALGPGEHVLGNDPGAGINLADQEGSSPRRMAAQQAKLAWTGSGFALCDLASPGGTFVNRQRVPAGQDRPLQGDDVIQIGGVQLRVVAGGAAPPARAGATTFGFTLKAGPTCRSWDDFLTISAQRWSDLRDELTSGRLAAFLVGIGRSDLAPDPAAPGTPDERLDTWLGRLPVSRPAQPELDVHPSTLAVRWVPGSGMLRQTLHVHNVGYRLLRVTASIEPPKTPWLQIGSPYAGRPLVAVDSADLPLDVLMPASFLPPLQATVVLESNGGRRRVAVTLEALAETDDIPPCAPSVLEPSDRGIRAWVERQSSRARLVGWPAALGLLRVGMGLAGMIIGSSSDGGLALAGPALLFAILGAVLGLRLAVRRNAWAELPSCGFAGAIGGVLAAALAIAACKALEPIRGATTLGSIVGPLLWVGIGLVAAGLSLRLVPPKPRPGDAS